VPVLVAEGWTLAALLGDGRANAALLALADWPLAQWLRRTGTAYIFLNAGHILSIGLMIGSILLLDLRLLGRFRRYSVAVLAPPLAAMALAGTVLAIATGFALFTVRPDAYLANQAFLAKLALIAAAIGNALALRLTAAWDVTLAGAEPIPGRVRLAAALSLLLWPSALLAGRWIGFL
jgi:hypothetical protein